MRYQFIRDHAGEFRVRSMCRVLDVSRSGFYEWRDRPCSARSVANTKLLACIRRVHQRSSENYGAIKTWKALRAQGQSCGRHRVARLRQAHGIEAKRLRRFRSGNAARHTEGIAPNLLRRRFTADTTNQVWVGDTTFVPTREGWLQLAVLMDLHSRRIVGWAMGSVLNSPLVIAALTMALESRRPKPGLLHHTDQGTLYGSAAYRAILQHYGLIASMSRKGNCHDNAVAESFFSNLKNELTWHRDFKTRDEARTAIFEYIELFYNRERIHATLDYVSPIEHERRVGS